MTLCAIFKKPVNRHIEGVIKADDEAGLRQEIEEYVLTNEVAKRLEAFLDAYKNYQGANGVWISGFFGSGKSHLLKILAFILENKAIDSASALELFLPKCGDNEILRSDLKIAAQIPSKSILFNIDQKADVISKKQIDALLAVFVKVFDEMCGYYGKLGHIAQFERDLDKRNLYANFREAYFSVAGKPWEQGREESILESKNIAKAYSKISGDDESSAIGILDKYRNQYRVSIEDFAEQINAYIEKQPDKFRLNFFVDEVGQYIADNVKLMTNLQTIAESLATKCKGRAWVIVTAQEDMNSVVGEMTQKQGNDFTKIQARFKTRMKLTSTDVAEVIQKRLLLKTDEGIEQLTDIYHKESNNFKTLFDFADGAQTYRNYLDRDHFIQCYPFIPYQFILFQSAIQRLSQHNAFEGKHSSVGERSMLGVFQQVAIHIGDQKIGQLATFDLMFEGIRTALKASTQQSIHIAERNLDNIFAISLLKTLFLVKYVKEFKATPRNLCVLMLESFNQDIPKLRKNVEEALNLLEQQTYIQRNGDLYEFLTDEEKDIEQEIKSTEVDTGDIFTDLEKLFFDNVIKNKKIRYDDNGQDYSFTRKLDDKMCGKEYELSIHIASPLHEHIDDEYTLRMQSTGRDELLIQTVPDNRFVNDLLMYKRTDKYIRQNTTIVQQDMVKRILESKSNQNRERYMLLQQRAETLLASAKLYVLGTELTITTENAQKRITTAFYELIARVYPNLRMLRNLNYKETEVGQYLKNSHDGLILADVAVLSEPEQELFAFIQSNSRSGLRTTIKAIIEKFERKPQGWYYAAILCITASLCARGKVEIRHNGELLEEEELERKLCSSTTHANIVLEPQVEFTASQVRILKDFFGEFFDTPPKSSEAKALGKEAGTAFQELHQQLCVVLAKASQYPFITKLSLVVERISQLTGKPYAWYLTDIPALEDELLDMKEGIIDPIRKFMNGTQKEIFDEASKFIVTQEPNFPYLEAEELTEIVGYLKDPECFKNNRMQQVKTQIESLQTKMFAQISLEISKATEIMTGFKQRLCGLSEYNALTQEQQQQITRIFDECIATIGRQNLIAVIRDTLRRFEESQYQQLLSQIETWGQIQPISSAPQNAETESNSPNVQNEKNVTKSSTKTKPRIEYIQSRSVPVTFNKAWLADETDVDKYLKSVRDAFLQEIRNGKRIQI